MAAAGKGRHVEIGQLLGCGADPTQKSKDGSTAADWARRFGHEDIAATLDEAREQLERLASAEDAALTMSQYQLQADPDEVDLDLAQELIHWILRNRAEEMQRESGGPAGAILVFLPGWNEISQLRDQLAADARFGADVLVLPLHSMVPPLGAETRVPAPSARGEEGGVRHQHRRDGGDHRRRRLRRRLGPTQGKILRRAHRGVDAASRVDLARVRATAQRPRRSRAARGVLSPVLVRAHGGVRGFPTAGDATIAPRGTVPAGANARRGVQPRGERGGGAAAVGTGAGSTAAFLLQAVEPPVPQAISNAVGLLQDIGALKEDESLTRLGRHLGEMPVHPRVGKMLLYATLLGVLDPVLTVACAAAYRSPFIMSMDGNREAGKAARYAFSDEAGGGSDHLAVVRAFAGWDSARARGGGAERQFNQRNCTSGATLNMLKGMRQQLVTALAGRGLIADVHRASENASAGSLVRAVLAVGMYPLIGRLLVPGAGQAAGGGQKATLATLRGEKVKIHPHSVNCKLHARAPKTGSDGGKPAPMLVCFDDVTRGEAQVYVRECTTVSPAALVLVAGSLTVEALPPVELPRTIRTMPRRWRRRRRRVRRRRRSRTPRGRRRSCATIGSGSASRSPCSRNSRACAFDSRARSPRRCNAPGRPSRRNSPRRWARRRCYRRTTEAPPQGDRAGEALGAGGYGQGTGMGGGRPGDWQCPRGCGTVFANKSNCFRCGAPKGGGGGGGGGGGRRGFGGGGRGGGCPGGGRGAFGGRGPPPHRACSPAEGADAEGDAAEVAAEVAAGGDELEGILRGF